MGEDTLSLTWTNFQGHLATSFAELIAENSFSDVTLISDDQVKTLAHKFVLSANSPVLKDLLISNPHSHPIVYLRGVKHRELQSLLQFMYLGEAHIHYDHIDDVMQTAKDLQIKELTQEFQTDDETMGLEHTENDNYCPEVAKDLQSFKEFLTDKEMFQIDNETPDIEQTENDVYCPEVESLNVANVIQSDVSENNRNEEIKSDTKKFLCEICESGFTSKLGLLQHTRTKHEGIIFSCNQCNYRSTYHTSVKRHSQSKHEGVRHSCDECEFQATRKSTLIVHKQAIHEGVRLSCNQCKFMGTQKGSLWRHQKTIHEGFRLLCDQCEFQAATKSDLKSHQQSKHEGVQIICDQCDYQCKRRQTLRTHKKSHHR